MAKTVLYKPSDSSKAQLVLWNGSGEINSYSLGLLTKIGRKSESSVNDISLASPVVSRRHAEIVSADGGYIYHDCGSSNGTYVGGKLVSASESVMLHDGDCLTFDVSGTEHSEYAFYGFFAMTDADIGEWSEIALTDEIAEVMIGRSAESGLQLDDETVSEKHASFFKSSGGWAIIDHGSTNGVYLRASKLSRPTYLAKNDCVRIGNCFFVFLGDKLMYASASALIQNEESLPVQPDAGEIITEAVGEPEYVPAKPRPVVSGGNDLVINIVERSVLQRFKRMTLLKDINISVSSGDMVLILGGSGAGKTTFINAVMGYEKASGTIMYKDTDIYEEYEQMKYEIGFVPQQDLLRGSDTVYDTLSNAAEMKLPRRMNEEKRDARITSVLEELGLTRERETLVSKLSGGQRKRLSIAVELISDPSLFFLDEPDSGIDDIMGRGLMENLRSIADRGKIVMVITHSPERAADLFDKVIVLAKSTKDNCGHLAFFGGIDEAFDFFGVSSFREIVKRINRPDENGEGLSDYYIEKYAEYERGEMA